MWGRRVYMMPIKAKSVNISPRMGVYAGHQCSLCYPNKNPKHYMSFQLLTFKLILNVSWQNGSVRGSPMQSLLSKQKPQTYKSFQLLTFELILNVTIIYVLAKRECMRVTNAVSVIQTKTPNIQVNPIVDL